MKETQFKVYVSDYDYPDLAIERSVLEPIGAEVIGLDCKTGNGLAEQASDADAILQQYAKIPRSTIEKLNHCKVICRYGIGLDILDVEACYEHGIQVTNVPDYCIDEVADHTLSMGLSLIRRLPSYSEFTRQGNWHWNIDGLIPKRFRQSIWGLVGFGRIAQNIARKLQTLGFTVLAYDPYVSSSYMSTHGVDKVDFDTLITSSDIVNLMCPHTPETDRIIGELELKKMKATAILVNGARGKLVDNRALYKALTNGWIASAGLDDPEEEPAKLQSWDPENNPLFSLVNCIITPHVAYVSEEALNECRRIAAENAREVLLGRPPLNPVKPVKGGARE
ncbi:putative Dehydrogenase [Vibrio nigripulchritudo SO65]|uniref:C-terminal binding protein n=1 Tax=Vibrio nigripulchritudo TaxID=28173 RepID=UPI0003B1C158|nr:C-terminal binding protein [Vibrio nigripulchritudo]CCN35049.1 putative Dehydrogenase [Vibrio nigripulchritudo AM115]CCN40738.1 putative Dehydrogenase [Vibrio nigripulchritudo FTn2]CCN64453.1 putative Dehydrogenase [Vibrio nigripulchritudo POn4]CCN77438.1 putative Dehydrogenase [Vibrio nigripulchritudo SO65]